MKGLEAATAFMRASNADAPVYIAVNAIKAKDEDVVEIFDQAGSLMKESETVAGCYLVEDGARAAQARGARLVRKRQRLRFG